MYARVTLSRCKTHLWCDRHKIPCYIRMIWSGWLWFGESRRVRLWAVSSTLALVCFYHKWNIVLWGPAGEGRASLGVEGGIDYFVSAKNTNCEWNGNYDRSPFFGNVGRGGRGERFSRTFSPLSPFHYPTGKRGFRLLNSIYWYRQCSSSMCSTTKIVTVAVILH